MDRRPQLVRGLQSGHPCSSGSDKDYWEAEKSQQAYVICNSSETTHKHFMF